MPEYTVQWESGGEPALTPEGFRLTRDCPLDFIVGSAAVAKVVCNKFVNKLRLAAPLYEGYISLTLRIVTRSFDA